MEFDEESNSIVFSYNYKINAESILSLRESIYHFTLGVRRRVELHKI